MSAISKNEFLERMKLYLTLPGEGVFTVHTGSGKKTLLQKKIYGEDVVNASQQREVHEKNLRDKLPTKSTCLLGIPSDCGGGIQRGANWGPLYLREALYFGRDEMHAFDLGDIRVIPHLLHDKYLNEETLLSCRKALYGDAKIGLPVSPLSIAYDFATHFHAHYPAKSLFTIGGDHSVSYPIVKAYLEAKKKAQKNVALIHFDAHTDLLDTRLGIDLCFGTWTYHILNDLPSREHLVQIGIRSSGKDRHHWEKTMGHKQIWAQEVLAKGAKKVTEDIILHLQKLNVEELYISFDIDVLDETYAGATGTPEPYGLSPYEPMEIIQALYEHFSITGSDIVEIAPLVKASHLRQIEPETTLTSAKEFAQFFLHGMGKK